MEQNLEALCKNLLSGREAEVCEKHPQASILAEITAEKAKLTVRVSLNVQ